MTTSKHRPAALAALLAAVVAAVSLASLAVVGAEAFAGRRPHARRASLPNPAVLAIPAPKEPIPFIDSTLAQREDPFFAFDAAAARVANTNKAGSHVIVVPAVARETTQPWPKPGRHICLYRTDVVWPASGGGTCVPLADFKREGIVSIGSTLDDKPDDVTVLVPNGVKTVKVESPTGSRTLRVKNNVVRFWRLTEQRVAFDGPSGPVRSVIAPGIE